MSKEGAGKIDKVGGSEEGDNEEEVSDDNYEEEEEDDDEGEQDRKPAAKRSGGGEEPPKKRRRRRRVISTLQESKWQAMFRRLLNYKERFGNVWKFQSVLLRLEKGLSANAPA